MIRLAFSGRVRLVSSVTVQTFRKISSLQTATETTLVTPIAKTGVLDNVKVHSGKVDPYENKIMYDGIRGKSAKVIETYNRMRKENVGQTISSLAYAYVIVALSRHGKWTEALELINSMDSVPPEENDFNIFMQTLTKNRQWERSLELFEIMKSRNIQPTVASYNLLIGAYRVGMLFEKSFEIFDSMIAQGIKPDIFTFNTLLHVCQQDHTQDKSMQVLHSMKEYGVEPDEASFIITIRTFEERNNWGSIMELFTMMEERGLFPCENTFSPIVIACDKHGEWQKILHLFSKKQTTLKTKTITR
jgi:pentatricopeptide repeat protein